MGLGLRLGLRLRLGFEGGSQVALLTAKASPALTTRSSSNKESAVPRALPSAMSMAEVAASSPAEVSPLAIDSAVALAAVACNHM